MAAIAHTSCNGPAYASSTSESCRRDRERQHQPGTGDQQARGLDLDPARQRQRDERERQRRQQPRNGEPTVAGQPWCRGTGEDHGRHDRGRCANQRHARTSTSGAFAAARATGSAHRPNAPAVATSGPSGASSRNAVNMTSGSADRETAIASDTLRATTNRYDQRGASGGGDDPRRRGRAPDGDAAPARSSRAGGRRASRRSHSRPLPAVGVVGVAVDQCPALLAGHQMGFDRCRDRRRSVPPVGVSGRRHLVEMPGHASAPLNSVRARIIRVFTVPAGMPSSCAASRVVKPSSTVAWTTARNSRRQATAGHRPGRRAPCRPAPDPRH